MKPFLKRKGFLLVLTGFTLNAISTLFCIRRLRFYPRTESCALQL